MIYKIIAVMIVVCIIIGMCIGTFLSIQSNLKNDKYYPAENFEACKVLCYNSTVIENDLAHYNPETGNCNCYKAIGNEFIQTMRLHLGEP